MAIATYSDNGGSKPNYYPNSFEDLPQPDVHPYEHEGGIVSRAPPRKWTEQDDHEQPRLLWQKMSSEHQEQTATNIAGHIQGAKDSIIQRQLGEFRKYDPSLAEKVEEMLGMKQKSEDPFTMVSLVLFKQVSKTLDCSVKRFFIEEYTVCSRVL